MLSKAVLLNRPFWFYFTHFVSQSQKQTFSLPFPLVLQNKWNEKSIVFFFSFQTKIWKKKRNIFLAIVVSLLPASCPLCSQQHLQHRHNSTYQQYKWVTDTCNGCGLFIGYFCLLAVGCISSTGCWTQVASDRSARELNDGSGTGWFEPSLSSPS